MTAYTWAVGHGMPDGLTGDEQDLWLLRRELRRDGEIERLRKIESAIQTLAQRAWFLWPTQGGGWACGTYREVFGIGIGPLEAIADATEKAKAGWDSYYVCCSL